MGHYSKAKDAIFLHTDTSEALQMVIKSDCKKRARLNAMRHVVNKLGCKGRGPKNLLPPDPLIVGRAHLNAPA